jgi:hypothetical protein
MDLADLNELSDAEVEARLVQRGMTPEDARSIVAHRDDLIAARQICEVIR